MPGSLAKGHMCHISHICRSIVRVVFIYFMAELGHRLTKTVRPIFASNVVHYLQMTYVGSDNLSEMDKERTGLKARYI
jgi:hypothetical protein